MKPCACRYDPKDGIRWCPLHAAAEELLAACQVALQELETEWQRYEELPDGCLASLRAAIKRAQGGLT